LFHKLSNPSIDRLNVKHHHSSAYNPNFLRSAASSEGEQYTK